VVSVLAIRSRVRRFKPGRGDGILRAIKIRSTPFGGEVKPEAPCRKILQRVKNDLHEQKYFTRPDLSFSSLVLTACYQMTAGMIARVLWWTNQEFPSVDIIPPWFSVLMFHLGGGGWTIGRLVAAVQRHSIDMIINCQIRDELRKQSEGGETWWRVTRLHISDAVTSMWMEHTVKWQWLLLPN
jgi:hypothetical protein